MMTLAAWPGRSQTVTFTNAVTISDTNTTYDGQDIVVDGATVTINGWHSFNSVLLTNGAVLTHSPCTTTNTHKLDLVVTNAIVISTNSRIDVSGKGYLTRRTSGNTTMGGATGSSGGSYGGLGGLGSYGSPNAPNAVYGDYADPDDWGSGGGGNSGAASPGGGLVRLMAGTLALDGQLLANGTSTSWEGGSGGGIYVAVNTLVGSGSIQARGGSGSAGGFYAPGGGGRVAVYASDLSGFTLTNVSAAGGTGGSGISAAGAGSVHVIQGRAPTRVKSFVPLGQNGGYLQQLDSVTLRFSRAVNTNSFTASTLQITGPAGSVSHSGLMENTNQTYQITFTPQSENGAYRFTLLPTLLDIEGFPLDQNANGIPGEPDDAFAFTLVLDTVAPRITQHTPNGDIAGTITNVDLFFSEAIDKTTFAPADITILNPTNGVVAVGSVMEVGFNRFRVAFSPQTSTGQYHVIIGTNITDLAGNTLSPSLGEGVAYDASFNLVPVDLELANVTPSTNQLWAGAAVSVAWQGRNNSGAPLLGNWIDAVYLSPDPFWNITDIRVGTVQHTGGLASNEVYTASLDFNVPGLLPGNYHLLVRADLGNQARETVETNNIVSAGPIPVMVHEMSIGGSLAGTLTPGNRHHYFAINVPSGESLRLTLDGQSGVNHLLVNHASIPTRLNSDVSGTGANSDQTITLTGVPGGGTYYVLVSGDQVGGNGNYTLTADSASFFLSDFTPRQLVGSFSQRFWVQILQSNLPSATLTGVGFDEATTVEFLGTNGSAFLPLRKEFVSPSMLQLVLPVEHWPAGAYNVRVTKGALSRVLTNALTVAGGGEAKLETRIIGTSLGPGGGQTLYVEYANTGTRPMPTPMLKVTAYTNAVIVTHRLNRRPQDALNPPSGMS
ncbi:MAG: Ig-like domain-containing protein, partial [Verrucomicrobia bacterium]|nr:Ig-like domain-containing protein [Verrucomicrobiota bacterium]